MSGESPGLHTWLMLWSLCAQPNVVNACSSTKLVSACIPSAWVVHAGAPCGLFVSHVCSNPFAGSSKLGRVLDHVPLIESEPPGPETEVRRLLETSSKIGGHLTSSSSYKTFGVGEVSCSHPGSKIHRPPENKALLFVAIRELLPDNIALTAHLEVIPGVAGGASCF